VELEDQVEVELEKLGPEPNIATNGTQEQLTQVVVEVEQVILIKEANWDQAVQVLLLLDTIS
jgi:hypothetical protein